MSRLGGDDLGRLGEAGIVDRHLAPADEPLAFLGDHLLDDRLHLLPHRRVLGQEELPRGVVAGLRQADAELCGLGGEETDAASAP